MGPKKYSRALASQTLLPWNGSHSPSDEIGKHTKVKLSELYRCSQHPTRGIAIAL